jgi:hypothetical protein
MARGVQIIEHDSQDLPSDQLSLATRMLGDGQVVSERTLFGDIITAQPIKAPRNEGRVLQKIESMAGAAGSSWFYRFPVKKKGGGIDHIEGPSIECTDAIARWYGNCQVASAVQDVGPAWLIHSRFCDLETGFTLIRPFLQSKAGSRLGGDDDERRLQIALSIGVSKSQRNVVVHALRDFTDRAFEAAKKNLIERVGHRLAEYRKRCIDKLQELGPDLLPRVERAINRKAEQWLAPDIARLIGEIGTVADGMAAADEMWPREAAPEPRRSDVVSDVVEESGAAAPAGDAPSPAASTAAATGPAATDSSAKEDKPSPPATDASADISRAREPLHDDPPAVKNWSVGDVLGQDAIIKRVGELAAMAASLEDIDAIEEQNHDKLLKIVGMRGDALRRQLRERRRELGGG